MTRQGEAADQSRYMTPLQVAKELQVSRATVYNLVYSGDLLAPRLNGDRSALRISRESFNDYCARIEAEAARRMGGAA